MSKLFAYTTTIISIFLQIEAFSQDVDFDLFPNINFHTPDVRIKELHVKEIVVYVDNIHQKKSINSRTAYDRSGFIIRQENFDNFRFKGSERISISRNSNSFLLVTEFDKIGALATINDSYSFWFRLKSVNDKYRFHTGSLVSIKNECTFLPDSNLWCISYINNSKVDSGIIYTDFFLKNLETESISLSDSSMSNDTLLLTQKRLLKNGINSRTREYYLNGKIIKRVIQKLREERLVGDIRVNYEYDSTGNKIGEEYYNGRWVNKKRVFIYDKSLNQSIILEHTFDVGGALITTNKFDLKEILIESIQSFFSNGWKWKRTVFHYQKDGLLSRKTEYVGNEIVARYFYEYRYFHKKR